VAKKSGPNLVLVFAVIVLVAGAGGALWMRHDAEAAKQAQAKAAADVPAVPKGRLQLLRMEVKAARYLALDEVRRTPQGVDLKVLVLGRSATALEGGASMLTEHKTVDCKSGRLFDGSTGYFDRDGKRIKTKLLAADRIGRVPDPDEIEALAACAAKPSAARIYEGFRAAQREVQVAPDDYDAVAAAHPDDPDVFAWLCASGARGWWRNTTPRDCDRAVALSPKSSWVRMERGFLNLKIGKRPQAEADFRQAAALDPKNAPARFAHGLILALGGDKAGSKRDRGQALDIDPKVVEWIETNYGFFVDSAYRTR
jgi:tetratricopeptide (TPR) repeat protein